MQGPKLTHATGVSAGASAAPPDQPDEGELHSTSFARTSRLLHDLNQPLSAITNYAQAGSQLIANGATDIERLKSLFDKIVQQSARAAAISQELRQAQDSP